MSTKLVASPLIVMMRRIKVVVMVVKALLELLLERTTRMRMEQAKERSGKECIEIFRAGMSGTQNFGSRM